MTSLLHDKIGNTEARRTQRKRRTQTPFLSVTSVPLCFNVFRDHDVDSCNSPVVTLHDHRTAACLLLQLAVETWFAWEIVTRISDITRNRKRKNPVIL